MVIAHFTKLCCFIAIFCLALLGPVYLYVLKWTLITYLTGMFFAYMSHRRKRRRWRAEQMLEGHRRDTSWEDIKSSLMCSLHSWDYYMGKFWNYLCSTKPPTWL